MTEADIEYKALDNDLDPDLVKAIIMVESDGNPSAVRFEPKWKYFLTPEKFAQLNKISVETEKNFQAVSFGLMQIMGTSARELGFTGPLSDLCLEQVGLEYGMKKLKSLVDRYKGYEDSIIAAYNGGSAPTNPDGSYRNQAYVDAVKANIAAIKSGKSLVLLSQPNGS